MTHELPNLPDPHDALEPHMSSETLSLHHGKHHATYIQNAICRCLLEACQLGLRGGEPQPRYTVRALMRQTG